MGGNFIIRILDDTVISDLMNTALGGVNVSQWLIRNMGSNICCVLNSDIG